MSNSKGVAFERELKNLLESNGFDCVRGASSKGVFLTEKCDLVATKITPHNSKTAYILVISCKVRGIKKKEGIAR
jgi:Holliday junction resolvase